MKTILENISKIFKKKCSLFIYLISIFIIWFSFYYFNNYPLIRWNYGAIYFYTQIFLETSIVILFPLFIGGSIYKICFFNSLSGKKIWIWGVGWFLWVLAGWCPACSISLATYLWLSSFLSFLPFWWLELKVLSFLILIYSNYSVFNNLEVCSIGK
ncbi:MAG: hypothetical protein ACD_49C00035G0007 [uncultured bacterium (gcode 4)]|uniref:Uncharacterized protein n=1 Tax=uncultured bacterium (gcode 4) TaxID=1234023 RepID=K2AXS9_9BACT|nr:MAG: hypothetical protein ACD_49C00035G0007 [uncultured bacterium (gcode 4)]